MNEDIRHFVQCCPECQCGKGHKAYKRGALQPLEAHSHGEVVHFDFAGPFYKKLHILVMVDHYTGATMFYPCSSENTENVVFGLIHKWIPAHGVPAKVVTDRGSGFIAHANKLVHKYLGIHKVFTSAYHLQSNAMAERRVQEMKKAFRLINISLDDHFTKEYTNDSFTTQLVNVIILLLPSVQFSSTKKSILLHKYLHT